MREGGGWALVLWIRGDEGFESRVQATYKGGEWRKITEEGTIGVS